MAVAVEGANDGLVNQLVSTAMKGVGRRDRTEGTRWPSPRISRVESLHTVAFLNSLKEGLLVYEGRLIEWSLPEMFLVLMEVVGP